MVHYLLTIDIDFYTKNTEANIHYFLIKTTYHILST